MNTEKLTKFIEQNREHFHLPEKVVYGYSDIGYYGSLGDQGPKIGDQFELQVEYTEDFYKLLGASGEPYWRTTVIQITNKPHPHKVEAVIFQNQKWLEGRKVFLERDDSLRTWVLTGMSDGVEYSEEILGAMKTVRHAHLEEIRREEEIERKRRKKAEKRERKRRKKMTGYEKFKDDLKDEPWGFLLLLWFFGMVLGVC